MKVLVVDSDRCGVAFSKRCAEAGHEVRYFLKPDPKNPDMKDGNGFGFKRINNWVSSAQWADLIFMTYNGDYVERLEFFRKKGCNVFAPSVKSTRLEVVRGEGMKFLADHDIEVPPYKTFKSLKDAEQYVRKTEERFVFKTLGDNEDKSLSYCSKSPADMISRLQHWQKIGMNPKGEVMLQTFIEGVEFAVSRWMGTEGFIGPYNENFEHKNLMAGGSGPNTGEMGTAMAYVEESALGDEVLAPLEDDLVKMGHLGDIDVNCIIDKKGQPWPLEFTSRPGWPAFNIMMSEHKGDPCQWMLDACQGKDTLQVSYDVTVGVMIAIPPFPGDAKDPKTLDGLPIYGVTKQNEKYVYPLEVYMSKQPDMKGEKVVEREIWTTAGEYVAVVTGMGKTVKQAADRAYKTADEIKVADKMVRNDIGHCLKEKIETLHDLGYAESFEYGADS